MKTRKITSLTALVAFCLMILTSIILYVVPQGRVAYWADWRLWGLSKTQWGALHINFGFLFLSALVIHIYLNWKPILSYFKDRARQVRVFNVNFVLSLLLVIGVGLGTYFMIPPFSTVLDISEGIKNKAAVKYGEPPFGHAELAPLKSLAKKTGLDMKTVMEQFDAAGIRVDGPDQVFLAIAKENGRTPKELFALIQPPKATALPELPPPGTGNKTIAMLVKEFGLDKSRILDGLSGKNPEIRPDQTIKSIANALGLNPIQVYDLIRSFSE